MGLAHDVGKKVGNGFNSMRAGADKLASHKLCTTSTPLVIAVTSPAFLNNGPLPQWATKDGEGMVPVIAWSGLPASTHSIAVICEDPDAPLPEPFAHWLVYGIPADTTTLDAKAVARARVGKNSNLATVFAPAAPPVGHGVHRYHFQVFALDFMPALGGGAGRSALLEWMRGHVLAWGELVGTYERV